MFQEKNRTIGGPTVVFLKQTLRVTQIEAPAICSSISQHAQKMHRFFIEDNPVFEFSVGVPSQPNLGWLEEEIRLTKVNYTFKNLEDKDEVS